MLCVTVQNKTRKAIIRRDLDKTMQIFVSKHPQMIHDIDFDQENIVCKTLLNRSIRQILAEVSVSSLYSNLQFAINFLQRIFY